MDIIYFVVLVVVAEVEEVASGVTVKVVVASAVADIHTVLEVSSADLEAISSMGPAAARMFDIFCFFL